MCRVNAEISDEEYYLNIIVNLKYSFSVNK